MAITKVLAGGIAIAALASAAPAAAQYYPGYGSGYGGNVVGQVLNQVLGGGYGYNNGGYGYNNGGYGVNSQTAVNQCANAVQARLGGYNTRFRCHACDCLHEARLAEARLLSLCLPSDGLVAEAPT